MLSTLRTAKQPRGLSGTDTLQRAVCLPICDFPRACGRGELISKWRIFKVGSVSRRSGFLHQSRTATHGRPSKRSGKHCSGKAGVA
jgi:hypothetical protein